MDVREKIFRCRLRMVEKTGVLNTGASLKLIQHQLIPENVVTILAKYFNEVTKLSGKELKEEHKRYLVKKGVWCEAQKRTN